MRFATMVVCVVLFAGCTKADAPPATDTAAIVADAASGISGVWDVRVMPVGKDTVVTTYVLNATDPANWTFAFPNRESIAMVQTGTSGDTVMTSAGPFESALRPGVQVSVTNKSWIENGVMKGLTTARYPSTGADSVAELRFEGTKQ